MAWRRPSAGVEIAGIANDYGRERRNERRRRKIFSRAIFNDLLAIPHKRIGRPTARTFFMPARSLARLDGNSE
jgi:hypothetical protein